MKKLCCMIALAAISFGSVYAETPVKPGTTAVSDTTKMKTKKSGTKTKKKMKKDTTMSKM